MYGWEDGSDRVTIEEITLLHESSGATAGTLAATEDSSSVRENGLLSISGISAAGCVYDRSWYRGDTNLGDVVALEDLLPDMFLN